MKCPIKPGLWFYFLPVLLICMCQNNTEPHLHTSNLLINIVDNIDGGIIKHYSPSHQEIQKMCRDSIQINNHLTQESETWTGIVLDTLITTVTGITSADIGRIFISSPDGFYSSLSDFHLKDGFPLAYYVYSEKEDSAGVRPMKIFFPRLQHFYWVNNPSTMTITLRDTLSIPHQIRFDYFHQQSHKEWLRLKTLLRSHFSDAQFLRFLTSDGIFREYPINGAARKYILIRKEDGTWELTGDEIHYGLELRQIFFIASDSRGLFMKIPSTEEEQTFSNVAWERYFATLLAETYIPVQMLHEGSTRPLPNLLLTSSFDLLFGGLFNSSEVDHMYFKRAD